MSIHLIGVVGLIVIFLIGTLRPINLGVLALAMTFIVGGLLQGEGVRELSSGFPVDLFILLAGVTYLFGVAVNNGTVSAIVEGATGLFRQNGALVPWVMFVVASLPAMAGALGSAGVAMLAPIALRLAHRYDIDRRMMGLMVIYGAGAGNFSPLNVLGALVNQTTQRAGLSLSVWSLFLANLVVNAILAGVAYVLWRGYRARGTSEETASRVDWRSEQVFTVIVLLAIAVAAFVFNINIGYLAFAAGAVLQLVFPKSSGDPEKKIAWGVVLLVCGIVTYVAALQRYGTIDTVGNGIADLSSPMLAALLLCAIGAITSAFASSAGILGALVPLALPLMVANGVDVTGLVIALSLSATVVDATPFSTVGALVVANSEESDRPKVYRGLLSWGAVMVVIAPPITWLFFVVL